MIFEKIMNSLEDTERFAIKLANLLMAQDTITLEGDLGAGKTTFTKALAKGLGVTRTVNSPTFTIVKQYEGRLPFNHLDVYRLAESDELTLAGMSYFTVMRYQLLSGRFN
ncbi:tRNA threonylcarbamoyladenosine biosynthesis protein TsaE OS=Lysinibacillus sphaericus OX=1421 GN=tsaE PE=3 SV=1 [Lysinibacillus sphaericus]